MKGFDDHLDNYGDPDPGDDEEPTVIVEGREYATLASGDVVCPECGARRSTGRIADHMASEHSDDDYTDEEPPFDENHYRYHTPAGPNPACVNCQYLNWNQP